MIKIYNEDCFKFLPAIADSTIDLILIDPPYKISRETGFRYGAKTGRNVDRFRISMKFGDWDENFSGLDEVIKECFRILKSGGTLICFYDLWKISTLRQFFLDANFKQLRFIEWIKPNPVPINSKRNYLRPRNCLARREKF